MENVFWWILSIEFFIGLNWPNSFSNTIKKKILGPSRPVQPMHSDGFKVDKEILGELELVSIPRSLYFQGSFYTTLTLGKPKVIALAQAKYCLEVVYRPSSLQN
jgi:hypothetical protein